MSDFVFDGFRDGAYWVSDCVGAEIGFETRRLADMFLTSVLNSSRLCKYYPDDFNRELRSLKEKNHMLEFQVGQRWMYCNCLVEIVDLCSEPDYVMVVCFRLDGSKSPPCTWHTKTPSDWRYLPGQEKPKD